MGEKQKKDMTAQFEAQKAKVDAMPEVKEMMKMKGQMESAVKDYDSSVPRMKAKLPAMKEVRDKKAKKDKFVAQNKARREEGAGCQGGPEEGRGQETRRREGAKREEGVQEKADAEKKKIAGGGASWSPLTGLF